MIIINIVLSGTIPICCFRYSPAPPSLFHLFGILKGGGARKDGGILDSAYTKTPRCFFGIICYSFIFFVLNTGVGGVGGWAVRVHARTRTRNIPSPSFARGSLRGAQARWEGGKGDDVSKTGYRFIPISSSSHTLGSTSLSSVFPTSQMEKAVRSALRRIMILVILRVFFDLRRPSQWRTWTGWRVMPAAYDYDDGWRRPTSGTVGKCRCIPLTIGSITATTLPPSPSL